MLRVYAQSATASAPIIGASCAAPAADCPGCAPHNVRYVQCPPRKEALRGCRCAGSLIFTYRCSVRWQRALFLFAHGAAPGRNGSLCPFRLAPCSPRQGLREWPRRPPLTRLRSALA